MAMFSVSALSRFSAISNDVRVRVLGSKNRLTTVLPRSAGTFLIGRVADFLHRLGGVEDERDLLGRRGRRCPSRCLRRSAVTRVPSIHCCVVMPHLLPARLRPGRRSPAGAPARSASGEVGRFLPT